MKHHNHPPALRAISIALAALAIATLACNAPIRGLGTDDSLTTEAKQIQDAVALTLTVPPPTMTPVQAVSAELGNTDVPPTAPAPTEVGFETQSEPAQAAPAADTQPADLQSVAAAPDTISGLAVSEISIQPAIDGSWNVTGQITNTTPNAYSRLEITLLAYDADGTLLLTDLTGPLTFTVASGESAPFTYNLFDVPVTPPTVEAFVTNGTVDDVQRAGLAVVAQTLSIDEDGGFHCTGALINNNGYSVSIDQVAAVATSETGALLSAGNAWAVNSFVSAGDVTPYRISMLGTTELPQGCSIFVDAREAIAEPTLGIEIVDQEFIIDSFGNTHLVGELRNTSDTPLQVQLVAGLYDEASNVVDADGLNMPIVVAAGEVAPFDLRSFSATSYNDTLRNTVSSAKLFLDQAWTTEGPPVTFLEGSVTNMQENGGLVTATVQLTNTSDAVAEFTQVTVALRNADQRVVGTETISVWDPISPGNTAETTIDLFIPAGSTLDQLTTTTSVRVEQ